MFPQYSIVRSKRKLSDIIETGARGTILMVYQGEPNKYEVEFVTKDLQFMALLTISEDDLEVADLSGNWSS